MARIPRRLDSIRETRRRPTPHNHPVVPVGGILWGDSHAAGVPVLSGPPQRVTTEPGCLPAGVPRHRRGRPGISRVPSVAVFAGTDLADPDPLFHAQHGLRGADLEGSRGGLAPPNPAKTNMLLDSIGNPFRLGTAVNLLEALEDVRNHAIPGYNRPFVVVHGDQDAAVPIAGSKLLLENSSTATHDKELHVLETTYHGVLADPKAEEAMNHMVAFVDARTKKFVSN
eukprot:CAMPEP_0168259630 /NCGR_PEP_ID=MMETSP0141_2-20121125/7859_1 /TAXON_ID=44445 /ORGANISM="Pseudo-nitzschia australis, Strain 10249 10 AB" /LENGTH=226 /DNA_ID=CAMNT_0008197147 /DNA_START=431 /DNA_END=1112 /DNA_ORIENTATION=+